MATEIEKLMQGLALDPGTRTLLYANGKFDRQRGVSRADGWDEVCDELGYERYTLSPARQAYEDGWYAKD